jgi:hypothetical protein
MKYDFFFLKTHEKIIHLLSRRFFVVFEIGSRFMPGPAWTMTHLFVLPHIARMAGVFHHTYPLVKVGSCSFVPELALNCDLPIHLPSTTYFLERLDVKYKKKRSQECPLKN